MVGEWIVTDFADAIDFQEGPGILAKDFHDHGVPLVRLSGLDRGTSLLTGCNYLDPDLVAKKWAHFALQKGDILLSTSASLGRIAVVDDEGVGAIAYTGIIRMRPRDERLISPFIRYLLEGPNFQQQAEAFGAGSVIRHFGPTHLRQMTVLLPPPAEQRVIADILGTLDEKIELNHRRSQTLEAMARALFKDWFVDFGPVRAKMDGRKPYLPDDLWQRFPERLDDAGKPEGWEMRPVSELSNVVYGAPFASKQFNSTRFGVPLIRIRDLTSHEPGVWTEQVHSKGHLIQPGDIVVGMDGEFRLHIWKGRPAWLNQRVCHFEPLPGVPTSFLAAALVEPLAYFERGKVGTTVIHLGKGDIDTFRVLHPGQELLQAFALLAEPWQEATVQNALESRSLTQLRDTLLPKLVSGELSVADSERYVEELVR